MFLIERYITDQTTGHTNAVAVLGVTSQTTQNTTPQQIATADRDSGARPWGIENRPHRVRDATYSDDHSRVRTDTAPHATTGPRNLSISTLQHAAHTNTATTLRAAARNTTQPLTPLRIH